MNQRSDLKDKDFYRPKAKTRKFSRLRLILAVRRQAWSTIQGIFGLGDEQDDLTSRQAWNIFQDLYRIFWTAEEWDNLTPDQKVKLEEHATDKLIELLELYNSHFFRSIHYRLQEKEPEEEAL